jgi:hypothetical protein
VWCVCSLFAIITHSSRVVASSARRRPSVRTPDPSNRQPDRPNGWNRPIQSSRRLPRRRHGRNETTNGRVDERRTRKRTPHPSVPAIAMTIRQKKTASRRVANERRVAYVPCECVPPARRVRTTSAVENKSDFMDGSGPFKVTRPALMGLVH